MADCEATNEDFRHLDDGLPADIARLKAAGELGRAVTLIEAELDAGTRPELAACLRAERARMLRTPLDFCVTRTRALAQVREECPEFSEADLDRLIDAGRVDWRLVEGEQRFLPSFLDALRKYPEEVPGLACPAPSRADRLGVIAEMRENGAAERRIRLRASIAADTDVQVGLETRVRCWLPVPAACPQICDARVIDATPDAQIAEADAQQRTAYWDVRGRREFFVDYEYTVRAPYVDLWTERLVPAPTDERFAPAPAPTVADVSERRPHIAFTPYLRGLASRIFEGFAASDQLGRARAAYDWVTNNVDYRFQPAYLLLDGIADGCAKSLRGDCGVFAITFITLCRLGGVPARWQSGLYAAPGDVGPHDWAMFHVDGLGWLWADCSFGSGARREGDEERRRFYFGNLGPWRMPANSAFFSPLMPADEALRTVGLADKAGQDYLTLSGGEKQLCILARTIAEDAPLLLLDEPDSALDLANRSRMTALLAQLVHTGGKTALVCLHDPALALDSCDILVVLQGGGVAAVLHPRTDPPAVLQAALAAVYGPLELLPVTDCRGRRRLALLPL